MFIFPSSESIHVYLRSLLCRVLQYSDEEWDKLYKGYGGGYGRHPCSSLGQCEDGVVRHHHS